MSEFLIDFVLAARKFDERGLLYYQEVSRVDPSELLEDLVRTHFYVLNGGYCLVDRGRVWNATGDVAYDPCHVYCHVDDITMAHMVLSNVLDQFEDNRPVQTLFLESVTIDIRPHSAGRLLIEGNTITGTPLFRQLDVPLGDFFEQLHKATTAFVSFAQKLAAVVKANTSPAVVKAAPELLRNMGMERWQAGLERLTMVREQIRQEPSSGNWRK